MFGSVSLSAWGTSQWGAIATDPGAVFAVDAVVDGEEDKTFSVDALVGGFNLDAEFSVDAVVEGDGEVSFAVDAAVAQLPPEIYAQLTTKPYVLVELDLPAGKQWVASKQRVALGRAFDARLIGSGVILRTIGAGTDTLSLTLDDTTTHGAQRFRDLFNADDPEGSVVKVWLGAEGANDGEHMLVFEGKVERVTGLTHDRAKLEIVRREQIEDVLLGKLVDETTFPDAPAESVSMMLPIVFGVLDVHEGVVVNTLETGSLEFNILSTYTYLLLVDASTFPAAGIVLIGSEQISYAAKVGNYLVGLVRGVAVTAAADHPKGSEVAEVGSFQVRFSSHALGFARRFKIQLPNGNLGDPVPQPNLFDYATATATWIDGLPQIRDPDARPTYQRIHFKDEDPLNTATNASLAARENPGYSAFGVAQVPPFTNMVLLTNTEGLGAPGDISRVWLGVIFDPDSVLYGIATVASKQFTMMPTDSVPDAIARNDERTGDRIYDVPPPVINVAAPTPRPFELTPKIVVDPGLFQTVARAGLVVDEDDTTFAAYSFVGFGESLIAGGGDIIYKFTDGDIDKVFPDPQNHGITRVQIRFLAGMNGISITSPWEVYMRRKGKEIQGTRFSANSSTPLGGFIGFVRGVEEFTHDIIGRFDDPFTELDIVLHPVTGVSSGLWAAHELSVRGAAAPLPPAVTATQDVRHSVSNYFEVTSLMPTVNGQKDWSAFSDLAILGRAQFVGNFARELRVLETFWVVEFTPFVAASSKVPRVFADVSGLVASGEPTEIAKELVTRSRPEGMGLNDKRYDHASYMLAASSLRADGIVAAFAIRQQISAVELLSALASQTDCRDTWENERHRVVRLPRADQPLPVSRQLSCSDYFDRGDGVSGKTISKASAKDVVNKLTVKLKPYAPTGETSKTFELNDATSQATRLGIIDKVLSLTLLQSEAAATVVAQRKLERLRFPRWIVEVDIPVYGIAFRQGDLVSSSDPEFPFLVGEVTQVNLDTNRLKKTRIQIVVWHR